MSYSIRDFSFRINKAGEFDINPNLWGYFRMIYRNFQQGTVNIGDNIKSIVIPGNPADESQARIQYMSVLGLVRRYLDADLQKKGFATTELGLNEAIALFYAIRATIDRAREDKRLRETELTYCESGFTGLLNSLLGTRQNVDEALADASQLQDEDLIRRICEDINFRAIRARRQ